MSESGSQTPGSGSRQRISSASSTGSTAPTARVLETQAVSASDFPSHENWSRRWEAHSRRPRSRVSAALSGSACAGSRRASTMARILVVEDEVPLSDLVRSHLEKEGHSVEQAFDGKQALGAADRMRPDLLVLDWLLPGLDGLSVCRELRRKHLMPILMLTARSEVADRVSGLQVGADDYLGKPFSIVELSARISSLLRRVALDSAASSPDSTKPITFGQLVLDPSGHRATLAGSPLDLSRREMELLELLVTHPARTFSRDYLLQRLWGSDFAGLDRAVDTQMVRLRRKLGDLGVCIETVWGVGYRFRPELFESAPPA